MKKIYSRFLPVVVLLVTVLSVTAYIYFSDSEDVLSKYGSRGQEVKNIQTRLKNWGYYRGNVDGIYGYQTANAVKNFQRKNRLSVDGIAGAKTLEALGLPTGTTNTGGKDSGGGTKKTASSGDLSLLAHLIHGEGRGEPYVGQVAIGAVVLNRVRDSRFPKTIAGVIYQPGAFDAVSDGQINLSPDQTAIRAAQDAINGWDPSHGCVYYYNPSTATSAWIWSRPIMLKIGEHNFAK